ncbi:MAG: restriction endonuclease [Patescibacteria group bacterium]
MARKLPNTAKSFVSEITKSGLSIYDKVPAHLLVPNDFLEKILQKALKGKSLIGLPPRTRSRVVKESVCTALGYPVPASFIKTHPRFVGQDFDIYIQKSNNLQIWNEEVSPKRRYVLIQVLKDKIARIKILNGDEIAKLDKTGTFTIKYQATIITSKKSAELISSSDTKQLKHFVSKKADLSKVSPIDSPTRSNLLSIQSLFACLKELVGQTITDTGFDQDRNRGAVLHKLICASLNYSSFRDNGSYPDILNQLLEVKLQTSPTIDLGKALPNSTEIINGIQIDDFNIRYCDIRYVLFYGVNGKDGIKLTHCYLTTGEDFFSRFPQFQGNTVNKKIQLPLPKNLFS